MKSIKNNTLQKVALTFIVCSCIFFGISFSLIRNTDNTINKRNDTKEKNSNQKKQDRTPRYDKKREM